MNEEKDPYVRAYKTARRLIAYWYIVIPLICCCFEENEKTPFNMSISWEKCSSKSIAFLLKVIVGLI